MTGSPNASGDESASRKRRRLATARGSAAYPRKRAVKACQVCRMRRTKCDNNKPTCSFCASSGAICVWDQNDNSTFDPASIAIIETLKGLEASVALLGSKVDNAVSHAPQPALQQILPNGFAVAEVTDDVHPQDRIDQLLPQNVDTVWTWSALRDISVPAAAMLDAQSPAAARRHASTPPVRRNSALDRLDTAAVEHYSSMYFRYVNIKNPIMEETEIKPMIDAAVACAFAPGIDNAVVLVVCALGALAQPFPQMSLSKLEVEQSAAMTFFMASQERLLVKVGAGVSSIGHLRWLFLAGTFLMATLRPFDAWRMFLQCLGMCQHTICVQHGSVAPCNDEHISLAGAPWISIYWSTWKSEREVRLELDPPDFHGSSLRLPPFFKDLSNNSDGRRLDDWYFYLSEISIWRIETVTRSRMESVIMRGQSDALAKLADIADDVLLKVASWRDSLAPAISIAYEDSTLSPAGEQSVYKFVLRGRTTYLHELITWPFIYAYLHDMTTDTRSWLWLKQGLAFHLERLTINRPGYYFRHHGTWLMMRTSARSASILLAAARTPSTRAALPPAWEDAFHATTKMLRFWADDVPSMRPIADRLQRGYLAFTQEQDQSGVSSSAGVSIIA